MQTKNQDAPVITVFLTVLMLAAMAMPFKSKSETVVPENCDTIVVRMQLEDAAAALSMGGDVAELVKTFDNNRGNFLYAPVSYEEAELLKPYLFDNPHCAH